MWSRDKSVTLSLWCTVIMVGLTILTGIALPFAFDAGLIPSAQIFESSRAVLLAIYYCFCAPALIALFATYRILVNIRRGEVFANTNVKLLRIISWASFAGGLICLCGSPITLGFFALGLICGFFGVILRVVKNLIAAAVEIKTENDLTI